MHCLFTAALQSKLDEIISECFAHVYIDTGSSIQADNENSIGRYFGYEPFDNVSSLLPGFLLNYVFRTFNACNQRLQQNVSELFNIFRVHFFQDINEPSERFFKLIKKRVLVNYLLELRGFSAVSAEQEMTVAALVRVMLLGEMPSGFLESLLEDALSLPGGESVVKEVSNLILYVIDEISRRSILSSAVFASVPQLLLFKVETTCSVHIFC
jgi:hypothetical protein